MANKDSHPLVKGDAFFEETSAKQGRYFLMIQSRYLEELASQIYQEPPHRIRMRATTKRCPFYGYYRFPRLNKKMYPQRVKPPPEEERG